MEERMFAPTGERVGRRPKHDWFIQSHAWEISPIVIAPVLPGETLENLLMQSRVVTAPLKSRTVGWWLEYFVFYVPFRLMPDQANLVAMFIDPNTSLSPGAAAAYQYYDGRGYNFVAQCLQVVIQEWFRAEGESWSAFQIRANRPGANINQDRFWDSLVDTTVLPDGGVLGATQEADYRAKLVLEYRRFLRESGGENSAMDYEQILASYGASLAKNKDRDRPELLRYTRNWSYPTNTVEPTTGVPSTAVSWAPVDRADKRRFFQEPGFIFAVQVARPKVYLSNQTSFAAAMLDNAQRWLPPAMMDHFERSLVEFTTTQGPFGKTTAGFTNGYWLDIRDLFNYGDQYIDYATATDANAIALPTIGQQIRYATLAMADSLLVTAGSLIHSDGNMTMNIKTRVVEPS